MSEFKILLGILVFYISIIILASMFGIATIDETNTITFPDTTNLKYAMTVFNMGGLSAILGVFGIIGEALILGFAIIVFIISIIGFTFINYIPWYLNTIIFLPLVLIVLYMVVKVLRGT